MAVKIRLSRHGKKDSSFFHIIVTDTRSPRDGRLIELIGTYNPNTNPASIKINSDRALYWLSKGAQPSDTCRRILSYEGVLLRKHLNGGILKGAITEEIAEQKWNAWKAEKDAKLVAKKQTISNKKNEAIKSALTSEAKVNQERAEAIAKRKAEEAKAAEEAAKAAAEEAAKAAQEAAPATEAVPAETPQA